MSFFHEVYEKGPLPEIYNLEANKKIAPAHFENGGNDQE
jgi:hypothetical protein